LLRNSFGSIPEGGVETVSVLKYGFLAVSAGRVEKYRRNDKGTSEYNIN